MLADEWEPQRSADYQAAQHETRWIPHPARQNKPRRINGLASSYG